eukprot:gnl/MRDRNA2_/MRDRNA2_57923_c0_seq2.p1 gnl/MRDRNA2_/MRDRNA2_57923_c0~~gnl/MRDRNA2_/MRDRNA2_57923_c0_seq2.p1  ORF type:complete len:457 (+),score=123.30 gnl/MRDRNA2_/MRDRNA2_57923_c0_seq2:128-1498(+)
MQVDTLLEAQVSATDARLDSQDQFKKYIQDMQVERQYLRKRLAEASGEIRGQMISEREKLELQYMRSEELWMRLVQVQGPGKEADDRKGEWSRMQLEDMRSKVVQLLMQRSAHEAEMQRTAHQKAICENEARSAVALTLGKVMDAYNAGHVFELQDKCAVQEEQLRLLRQELFSQKKQVATDAHEASINEANEEAARELKRTRRKLKQSEEVAADANEAGKNEDAARELKRTRRKLKEAEEQVCKLQYDLQTAQAEKHRLQVLHLQPVPVIEHLNGHTPVENEAFSVDPGTESPRTPRSPRIQPGSPKCPRGPNSVDPQDFKSLMRQSLKELIRGRRMTLIQEGGGCQPCTLQCSKDLVAISVTIIETGQSQKSEVFNIPLLDVQQILAGRDDHLCTSTPRDQKTATIVFGREADQMHTLAFQLESIHERDHFVNSMRILRLAMMKAEGADSSVWA